MDDARIWYDAYWHWWIMSCTMHHTESYCVWYLCLWCQFEWESHNFGAHEKNNTIIRVNYWFGCCPMKLVSRGKSYIIFSKVEAFDVLHDVTVSLWSCYNRALWKIILYDLLIINVTPYRVYKVWIGIPTKTREFQEYLNIRFHLMQSSEVFVCDITNNLLYVLKSLMQ